VCAPDGTVKVITAMINRDTATLTRKALQKRPMAQMQKGSSDKLRRVYKSSWPIEVSGKKKE